jgi:hypothetical protein
MTLRTVIQTARVNMLKNFAHTFSNSELLQLKSNSPAPVHTLHDSITFALYNQTQVTEQKDLNVRSSSGMPGVNLDDPVILIPSFFHISSEFMIIISS